MRSTAPAKDDFYDDEVRLADEQGSLRRPANDDRESIGQILRTLQRRPARTSYMDRDRLRRCLGVRRAGARLDVSSGVADGTRPDRADGAVAGRAGADLLRADHLLLCAGPYGLALAGIAAHHSIHGRGRHASGRARDGRARVDRHRRTGDPPRGRRDGRRHRARAGARRRARDAGGERGLRPRACLQRQRGAYPRAAAGFGRPARHPGRPGRADPRRHQQRAPRSEPRHFPDQRARGRAGQRGVPPDHPYARGKRRAHHARARATPATP